MDEVHTISIPLTLAPPTPTVDKLLSESAYGGQVPGDAEEPSFSEHRLPVQVRHTLDYNRMDNPLREWIWK